MQREVPFWLLRCDKLFFECTRCEIYSAVRRTLVMFNSRICGDGDRVFINEHGNSLHGIALFCDNKRKLPSLVVTYFPGQRLSKTIVFVVTAALPRYGPVILQPHTRMEAQATDRDSIFNGIYNVDAILGLFREISTLRILFWKQ